MRLLHVASTCFLGLGLLAGAASAAPADDASLADFVRRTDGPWLKRGAEARRYVATQAFAGAIEIDAERQQVSMNDLAQLDARAARADALHASVTEVRCHVEGNAGTCWARAEGSVETKGRPPRKLPLAGTLTAERRDKTWRYTSWHLSPLHLLDPATFSTSGGWDLDDLAWKEEEHAPGTPGARRALVWEQPQSHARAEFLEVDARRRWTWSPATALHVNGLTGSADCRRRDGTTKKIESGVSVYLRAGEQLDCESAEGARLFLLEEGRAR
jgi:hypothetical protein